jgi:hypothetical protein
MVGTSNCLRLARQVMIIPTVHLFGSTGWHAAFAHSGGAAGQPVFLFDVAVNFHRRHVSTNRRGPRGGLFLRGRMAELNTDRKNKF